MNVRASYLFVNFVIRCANFIFCDNDNRSIVRYVVSRYRDIIKLRVERQEEYVQYIKNFICNNLYSCNKLDAKKMKQCFIIFFFFIHGSVAAYN